VAGDGAGVERPCQTSPGGALGARCAGVIRKGKRRDGHAVADDRQFPHRVPDRRRTALPGVAAGRLITVAGSSE
jgi:hypothetical protein